MRTSVTSISPLQKQKLVDVLLRCSTIASIESRLAVLEQLPPEIANNIRQVATNKVHVMNIVNTCLNYDGGLVELVDALRYFEEDSLRMREVDETLKQLGIAIKPVKEGDFRKLLPYLVNRLDQVLELEKTIKSYKDKRHPLICLIHGEDCQGTEEFVYCIAAHFLPKWIGDSSQESEPVFLGCDTFNNVTELHEKIRYALNNQWAPTELGVHGAVKKIGEICRNSPVILETNMSTQDWIRAGGVEIIHGFAKFWADLGDLCSQLPQSQLVLICLRFTYEKEHKFFKWFKKLSVNEKIRNTLATLQFKEGVKGVILPELHNIVEKHVTDWASYHLKDENDEKLKQRIRSLFKNNPSMAMEHLARKLKKML